MPAFRGPDGRVVYVPEDEAHRYRNGDDYQEVSNDAAGDIQNKIAPTHTGVLGSIGATISGGLSGATLGASDWLLKGVLDKGQFEQLAQDRADNPILSGTAQAAGMVLPALVSGGAATPAGALGRLAAEGIETGRATGGALGVAQQLAAAGGEGAIANAGIYLSDVALGDRNLTAEGINGALGTGLLFGAAGVPVARGIEAGTIAARRMFARYAEGGAEAADAAAAAWTEKAQRHMEGFDQAAELAQAKLAETQAAREAANLQRLRAGAEMADARAFTPPSEFPAAPAGAPAAVGGAAETAVPGAAVAAEPTEVTGARALRDRAQVLGGEPITPEEVAALEQKIGKRFYSSKNGPRTTALDELAQHPDVPTAVSPAPVFPVTADEAELGARLGEYQAARRAFDEVHAQVDPAFAAAMGKLDANQPALDRMLAGADQSDLETLLHRVDPGARMRKLDRLVQRGDDAAEREFQILRGVGGFDVQRPPVAPGEFGAPGAGGFKSQDELARLAAGTDADAAAREVRELTAGRAARSEEGTAVLAKGTQPRSLGEVAAEQSPVPIELPKKNPRRVEAAKKASAASVERRREIHSAVASNLPQELQSTWDAEGYKFMQEEGPRIIGNKDPISAASNISEAFAEKYGSASETGRGYEGDRFHRRAEIEAKHAESWAKGQERKYHEEAMRPHAELAQIAKGSKRSIEDLTELFEERAAIHEFEAGNPRVDAERLALDDVAAAVRGASAPPATETLTGRLRGMQEKLGSGEDLVAMGAPAREAYRAAKAERTTEAAAHFRGKAIAAREARAGAVAAGETPNPFHEQVTAGGGSEQDQFFARLTAPKTRDAYVAANIGRAIREEGSHAAALAKVEREWTARGGHPLEVKRLEMAHDEALERAATAADPAERAAAAQEAQQIEKQITQVGARPGAVEDIAAIAPAITRVEKAAAALTEALGDAAPAAAKDHAAAFRAAEDEASRKTVARIGQAADDAATGRAAAQSRDLLAPRRFDSVTAIQRGAGGGDPEALGRMARHQLEFEAHARRIAAGDVEAVGSLRRRVSGMTGLRGDALESAVQKELQLASRPPPRVGYLAGKSDAELHALAAGAGHPLSVRRLEMAHDAAVERAAVATDPAERAAAVADVKAIEQQLTTVDKRPGAVEDEAGKTVAQSRDPLASPPRAADDLLLGPSQKQQRIAAAQKAQREAGAAYAKARVAEAEAQVGAKQAAGAAADARAKLGPPPEAAGAAPGSAGIGHRVVQGAHVVGFAADLASDVGIPGIPRPHDIPVIGPMLSAYLKYRALRAAAGRFMGRVPATAETRAAALAARTRDGIARAVDRSLGILGRNANTARAALTVGTLKATAALSKRMVDDGAPDAPAKASVSEQAAVRMREVAAVVANPSLVQASIRMQGRALTDPDLIDALSTHLLGMFQYLNEVAPKGPPPNPFTGKQWTPSPAEAIRWGQQVAIARDPQVAFEMLEAGTLTRAGADTLRKCYALLFRDGQARVIQRATDLKHPVDYSQLLRLGRLFGLPLHPSQDPEHAAVLAGAHTPATKPAPAAASSPPTPSIAGPTTLSNLYQPSGERAQRSP